MPRIIDRLEDFGKELIDFISDSSEEGNKRLQEVFKKASKEYNQYQDSYLWSWLYYYTRQRTAAFEKTISALATVVDPIIQLQEFRKFVSEGEWKSTSANMDLYIFLIRSIEGYEPEDDHVLRTVIIPRLNQLICKDIDNLIKAHEKAMQEAENRKKELEAMLAGKRKEMENVVLCDAENTAKERAVEYPEKQVFSLTRLFPEAESSDWQLTWYDATGKANRLEIYGELKQLLQEMKVLPEENSSHQFKIKSVCTKLVEELLGKTRVLINPGPDLLKNLVSAYVLLPTVPIQIFWYDSLGNRQFLNLHKYPQLEAWLGPKTEFTEKDLPRLKMYLRHIAVRREVDEDKQNNIFEMLQKKHGVTLIATNNPVAVPAYKLITGTYLLIREPDAKTGAWVLYQRQKGGINQRINTDNWEAFHEILAKNKDLSAEELSLSVKNELRECIKNADKILVKNKSLCVAVNHFSADNAATYEPGTFIVTKQEEQWQLLYIDMLQKAIAVDLAQCSQVKPLFAQWLGFPESLEATQLRELSKLLANFKPAARLKQDDFSELERCLAAGKQKQEKQPTEESMSTKQTVACPEVQSKALCLAVNQFSPANAAAYKPGSFIVTKLEDQWQLFYIDTLQKAIPVDLDKCKQVKPLFAQWLVIPESLGEDQLEALSKSLGNYRPAARLQPQDLSAVEKFLCDRQQAQTNLQPMMVESPTIPGKLQQVNHAQLFHSTAKMPPEKDRMDSPVFTV